ncbi:MAG TPA: DUF4407 domain-containing protein [Terriglobia bacterium]|nr:DUF4407 domain-containing protein [Terriglobia bacterium]
MNNAQNDTAPTQRNFLWWCAGVVPEVLSKYPTEKAKYEGIGGAVLTTGVLAFFSGFYAIYSTLASGSYGVLISIAFGLLWGLAIFNLDRYIVSSLRKPSDPATRWRQRLRETWLPALPRIGLAVLIGITLSKPLELRLFQNAIAGQAAINQEQAVQEKRNGLIESSSLGTLDTELKTMGDEAAAAEARAQALEDEFHKEADGTGGSRRYGYSEVARVKQEAAVQARQQVTGLQQRLQQVQTERDRIDAQITAQVAAFRSSLNDDFLTRMRALSDLAANSTAVWWISTFVVLLIIGVEITPVVVKLLSPIGPYDVKLDAMNNVETTEALLKRDTTNRIVAHHYEHVETVERHANDVLLDAHIRVADEELPRLVNAWKDAKTGGSPATVQQLVDDVRARVLTERAAL